MISTKRSTCLYIVDDLNDSSAGLNKTVTKSQRDKENGTANDLSLSLHHQCRKQILKSLTLERISDIHTLQLPNSLKKFIGTLYLSHDLNTTCGDFSAHKTHFPNHPHHVIHRTRPAYFKIFKTNVLLSEIDIPEHGNDERNMQCSSCLVQNGKQLSQEELIKWTSINKPCILKCYAQFNDLFTNKQYYMLEYPVVSLHDFTFKLSCSKITIPEYLIWDAMHTMIISMRHLQEEGLTYNICDPHNYVFDSTGALKLENLLIYFHAKMLRFSKELSNYLIPSKGPTQNGLTQHCKATVWDIGCICYEMASQSPSSLLNIWHTLVMSPQHREYTRQTIPLNLPTYYSEELCDLLKQCLSVFPTERPTLEEIERQSCQQISEMRDNYEGPTSFLDLMPNLP